MIIPLYDAWRREFSVDRAALLIELYNACMLAPMWQTEQRHLMSASGRGIAELACNLARELGWREPAA